MRRFNLLLALSVLILCSCSGRDEWSATGGTSTDPSLDEGQGGVSLSLQSSGEFAELATASKASDGSVDVSVFFVNIYDQEGTLIKQWDEFSDMDAVIALDAGTYSIEAGSPDRLPAAFDQPIYDGTQTITIQPSVLSDMAMVCTLSNVKVSLALDETFTSELTNVKITISNGEYALAYTDGYDQAAYFMPGTLTIQVEANRVVDNSSVTYIATIDESEAQDHHIITFKAVSTGLNSTTIEVDNTTIDKDHEITVPGEDEEVLDPDPDPDVDPDPDPDEPGTTTPAPTVTGNGIGEYIGDDPDASPTASLTLTDAQANSSPAVDIVVTTDPSTTIATLKVRIDSPYLTESELANLSIPVEFDVANLESGSSLETFCKEYLIGDDDLKTLSTCTVSIGTFMPMLPSSLSDGTTPVTHKFHVTTTDALGGETKATLTIVRTKE